MMRAANLPYVVQVRRGAFYISGAVDALGDLMHIRTYGRRIYILDETLASAPAIKSNNWK